MTDCSSLRLVYVSIEDVVWLLCQEHRGMKPFGLIGGCLVIDEPGDWECCVAVYCSDPMAMARS